MDNRLTPAKRLRHRDKWLTLPDHQDRRGHKIRAKAIAHTTIQNIQVIVGCSACHSRMRL
jgi:hypothetical protein